MRVSSYPDDVALVNGMVVRGRVFASKDVEVETFVGPNGETSGQTCAFFLTPGAIPCPHSCGGTYGYYEWEAWSLNGGLFQIMWNPQPASPPSERHLFLEGPASSSNAWSKLTPDAKDALYCAEPGSAYWPGKPLDVNEAILEKGHLLVKIRGTYGHNLFSLLQRMNDLVWWLQNSTSGPQSLAPDFVKVFAVGGSFGGLAATTAALMDPTTFAGASGGGMMPDLGYNMPYGGWRMINGHRDAAIGQPVWMAPPRAATWGNFYAIEEMLRAPELVNDNPISSGQAGAENAAFSLLQRLVLEASTGEDLVQSPILGFAPNVDRHFNIHWYRDITAANDKTDSWVYFQHMGHGVPNPIAGVNEYFLSDGVAVVDALIAGASNSTENPDLDLNVDTQKVTDPYPNPYKHTLNTRMESTAFGPQSVPMLYDLDFYTTHHETLERIGQGVFPGNLDSAKIGDFDGDEKTELVFGNFDGFIHVLELDESSGVPLLKDEWRSPPLAWGISALDVGEFGSSQYIVAADSAGNLWKTRINGTNSYGITQRIGPAPKPDENFHQYLSMGEFSAPNQFVVQDEFHRWELRNAFGSVLSKTSRMQTSNTFSSMSGKPSLFRTNHGVGQSLIIPGMDGHIRRLCYTASHSPDLHTYTSTTPQDIAHLKATIYACAPFDTDQDPSTFWLVVGATGQTPGTVDERVAEAFLALFEITGNTAKLIDWFAGPEVVEPTVTLEWMSDDGPGELLVVSGNQIAVVDVSTTSISQGTNPPKPIVKLPGVPDPIDPAFARSYPQGVYTICSAEVDDKWVYVCTPNGRVFLYDKADLSMGRRARDLDPSGSVELSWPSNYSLGWTFGLEREPATTDADRPLHFLDSQLPFYNSIQSRVGTIDVASGFVGELYFQSNSDRVVYLKTVSRFDLDLFVDLDQNQNPALRHYGSIEVADVLQPSPGTGTLFTNYDLSQEFLNDYSGGYLYSLTLPPPGVTHTPIRSFETEMPPVLLAEYSPIPRQGGARLKGQITTQKTPKDRLYHCNSVMVGSLDTANGPKDLVVSGTLGGQVYAVDPSLPTDALIHFADFDLGWGVTGLDIHDMDGDEKNEIIVGTWIDTGTHNDYVNQTEPRHRGRIYIFKTGATLQSKENPLVLWQEISLDDGGYSPNLFGVGIFGLKVDNVDGQGTPEIWCGDGLGYLYCLGQNPNLGGKYTAFFGQHRWECTQAYTTTFTQFVSSWGMVKRNRSDSESCRRYTRLRLSLWCPLGSSPMVKLGIGTLLLSVWMTSTSLARDTWIVAEDGSGDFVSLRDAILAASEGDLLIIRPGTYLSPELGGKPLDLVGSGPGRTVIEGTFVAQFGSVGKVASLSHCTLRGPALIRASAEFGRILCSDLELIVDANQFSGPNKLVSVFETLLAIGARLRIDLSHLPDEFFIAGDYAAGLHVTRSTAAFSQCFFQGSQSEHADWLVEPSPVAPASKPRTQHSTSPMLPQWLVKAGEDRSVDPLAMSFVSQRAAGTVSLRFAGLMSWPRLAWDLRILSVGSEAMVARISMIAVRLTSFPAPLGVTAFTLIHGVGFICLAA